MKEAKVVRRKGALASLSYEPDPSVSGGGGGSSAARRGWPLRRIVGLASWMLAGDDDEEICLRKSIRDALVQKREDVKRENVMREDVKDVKTLSHAKVQRSKE